VSTSKDQRINRGSSQSRDSSESALGGRDLDVPSSPDFGWGKHATTTTHVTKSGLSRSVGSSSSNTRDTRHSSTSSPGLSRGLGTSKVRNSVGLTVILVHFGVNINNDVRTNRSSEDSWEGEGGGLLVGW